LYLQAPAPRVSCPTHGVIVAAVPWARHGSRFSSAFEDTVAWLACHAAVTVLAAFAADHLAVGGADPGGR
jgi:transposase